MASSFDNFGSLGDLFPSKEIRCRIRGCKNTLYISGEEAMHNVARGANARPDKMCDECYQRFLTLEDKELPCSKPGCNGTWIWNRFQQLENYATGHGDTPPAGFCNSCREEMRGGKDVEQPCRMKGCKNTWTWTKRMQFQSGNAKPPRRLCDQCFQTLKKLEDKELPCRVKGCKNTVVWNKYLQLEHLHEGKSLDNPPRRMCEHCLSKFQGLKNSEEPCKVHGCKGTWTYSAYEQLENLIACKEGETPEKPSRMCKTCFDFYNGAKDQELRCSNRGCNNTWTWTRSMQLGYRQKNDLNHPPSRMCDECQSKLKALKDIEQPCQIQSCTGTWTYRPQDQLHDQLLGRKAPQKTCKACLEYLASHTPQELSCERCSAVFSWSSQEQLLNSLGVFDKPKFCADCIQKEMAEIRPPEVKAPVAPERFTVKIPQGGCWNEDAGIRNWPQHMNKETIRKMEEADVRIVCFGDDLTFCNGDSEKAWPAMLEKRLQERYSGEYGSVAVLNAGIPGCTTRQAILRFERDVLPFQPHLVLFSFAFSDTCMKRPELLKREDTATKQEQLLQDFAELCQKMATLPEAGRFLCWLPNPVFPQQDGIVVPNWKDSGRIDEEARSFYESHLRQLRQKCRNDEITCLDGRSFFEIGGIHSALRWMENWYQPNEVGLNNFVGWFESVIRSEHLLPIRNEE